MDLDELVFHPWTVQGPRSVPTFVSGSGSCLIDAEGRRYLDFSSQLVFTNLGISTPGSSRPSRSRPTVCARLRPPMGPTSVARRRA